MYNCTIYLSALQVLRHPSTSRTSFQHGIDPVELTRKNHGQYSKREYIYVEATRNLAYKILNRQHKRIELISDPFILQNFYHSIEIGINTKSC